MMGSAKTASVYDKEEVRKWIKDNKSFVVQSESPRVSDTLKFVKVNPCMLKLQFPLHLRSQGNCEDSFEQTGYVECDSCKELLKASGGHLQRHVVDCNSMEQPMVKKAKVDGNSNIAGQSNIHDFMDKKFTKTQLEEIGRAISMFCLETGVAFNMLESDSFKKLLATVVNVTTRSYRIQTVCDQLPCRQTIKSRVEVLASGAIHEAHKELNQLLSLGHSFCGIVADHGLVNDDHLSLNVSIIDDRAGNWELKLYPVAFRKVVGKDSATVFGDITSIFDSMQIHVDFDRTLFVADGHSAMRKVGTENMLGYLRCVNHSVNLLCKHTLNPYEVDKRELSSTELQCLEHLDSLVKDCVSVCNLLHFDRELVKMLSKKPRKAVITRWLTEFTSVTDVLDIADELFPITSRSKKSSLAESMGRIMCHRAKLRSLQLVFYSLAACNKKFQERSILLNTVCPVYQNLGALFAEYTEGNFSRIPEEFGNDWIFDEATAMILGKSAGLSVGHLYSEFGPFHLAATHLDYSKRDMKHFDDYDKQQARECVLNLMCKVQLPLQDATPQENCQVSLSLFSDDEDESEICQEPETAEQEYTRYISYKWKTPIRRKDVSQFWITHRYEFPRLYQVAKFLLGTTPSEAEAERNFSLSSRIVNDRRKSLNHNTIEWLILSSQLAANFSKFFTPIQ